MITLFNDLIAKKGQISYSTYIPLKRNASDKRLTS